jgi:prophage endopeptidase
MNRTELIVTTAIILFIAYLLGWASAWVASRLRHVTTDDIAELDQMSSALHHAEEERDNAITYMQQRESELTNQLGQTEAELAAAMEGLGVARREAAELREYIDAHLA